MMFSSIDQAFDFYSEYAKKAGFGVRKGGSYMHDGVLKTKYFTCCKEGHNPAKLFDSKVYDFAKGHNHSMVVASDMQFVCSARKLTHVQDEAIYEMSNMNLGPFKAFNLKRTQYGGFEKVGATKDDCKNFKQGLNCYIGEYKMVFVPFTTIYNHCHTVTVGAGLLASQTIESYTWLLQMLLKSFGTALKVVVTDQDPAMKHAIASVFPNTRQVGADLCNNEDFKRRICDTVWTDSISPFEFEEKWQAIMVEFELEKNKWLDRYNGRLCDHDSWYTYPQLETKSDLEREAVRIYTRSIFSDVQDEMNETVGGVSQFSACEEEGGYLRCKIRDFNAYVPGFLEVILRVWSCLRMVNLVKSLLQHAPAKDLNNMVCCSAYFLCHEYVSSQEIPEEINDRWRKEAAVNIRTVPMSEFGNDQNRKIKEISREIKYVSEYLINSYVVDIDELIKD
ncbi:protein FAR1-RELATED SEQUENCE 5-like [Bidens hawaiensis]|uniref:protein FAR1-RELATED SEQUENCE 5-like n=1 Tax=Bidens hawaiensis TaxID=980011 RepID=UPI00404A4A0C